MNKMKKNSKQIRLAGAAIFSALVSHSAIAQISFNGTIHTENFDTLIKSGTNNGTFTATVGAQVPIPNLITWSGTKVAGSSTGNATTAFTADSGSTTSGLVYSYGSSNSTDRALGLLASGTNAFAIGTAFRNTSNQTITSLTIKYTGEYWRSSTAQQNTLAFAYGTTSSAASATLSDYLTNSALTPLSALDLVGPVPVTSNGALNGNVIPNRKKLSYLIENINWQPNDIFYIRWTDNDNGGSDAGLGIDDFLLANGVYVDPDDVPIGMVDAFFTPILFGGDTFGPTKNAVFDKTGTTVSLAGAVSSKSLKFTSNGYFLVSPTAADSITVSSGEVFVGTGNTATISGNYTGSVGLEKTGFGTLVLSGPKVFSGNVSISDGRLEISGDSSLGNATTITFGATLASSGSLTLGNRTLTGFGTIETAPGGSLTLGGPLANASLTLSGPASVALNGSTNSVGTLVFPQPVALTIGTGNATVSSGLTFSQSSGNSTITGGVNLGTGSNTLSVAGGTLTPLGVLVGNMTTGRVTKTGAGTLALTSTTFSGTGGFRLGIQGGFPEDGGKLVIDQASDLGTLQTQFNSGVLEATAPTSFTIGLSIGGRLGSSVPIATLAGGNMTFSGNSSFFPASSAAGDLGLNVTNNVTFSGNFTSTTLPTVSAPAPSSLLVNITGNGTLTFSGNASAFFDKLYLTESVTLVVASTGSLGAQEVNADSGSTVSGGGILSGYRVFPSGSGNTTISETYRASNATFYSGSTLAPTGTLAFRSGLILENGSTTILSINGSTPVTGYDSIDISNPSATLPTYSLNYGGTLGLDFGAPATDGTYNLFTLTGPRTARGSSSFQAVTLMGSYSGSLTNNATTTAWSGVSGNKTFTFVESSGNLTISTLVTSTPLETWRDGFFFGGNASTATTGPGADSADFDGDGVSNLIEYIGNTDPTIPSANPVVASTVTVGPDTFLTLTYPRRAGDDSLTYTVQASSDLTTGFTSGTGSTVTTGGNSTYTDDVSVNTLNPKRFLRLQVSHP